MGVARTMNDMLHWPVVTLPDDDLDALELLLGGLINDELSYPIGPTHTAVPGHPDYSGNHRVLLADRDRTPLALVQLATESCLETSVRQLTGPVISVSSAEHGPFRTNRITGPIPGQRIILVDGAPSPTLLERIMTLPGKPARDLRLVLLTNSADFRSPGFAPLLQDLEAASRLFGGSAPGFLVIPPGVPSVLSVSRLQSEVVLDARSGNSRRAEGAGTVVLLSGLSGSGKSTLGRELLDEIRRLGRNRAVLLDGDDIRQFLSKGLGFSREDRETNVERIGWVAARISEAGGIAICTPIAPFEETRSKLRELAREVGTFLLIHVNTPLEVCEQRDRKGLYAKARAGLIGDFTGISSPYELPLAPDLGIDTSQLSVDAAVGLIIDRLYPAGS